RDQPVCLVGHVDILTSRQARSYSLDIEISARPHPTEVQRLAAFVSGARWGQLDEAIREALRLRVLDSLGCAIAALDSPVLRAVRGEIDEMGGRPLCTV